MLDTRHLIAKTKLNIKERTNISVVNVHDAK
jgi:hypothetical protein